MESYQDYEKAQQMWKQLQQLFDDESTSKFKTIAHGKVDRFWEILLEYGQMKMHKILEEEGEYRRIRWEETRKLLLEAETQHRKEYREAFRDAYKVV